MSAKRLGYHIFASCNAILVALGRSDYPGPSKGKLLLQPDSSWQSPEHSFIRADEIICGGFSSLSQTILTGHGEKPGRGLNSQRGGCRGRWDRFMRFMGLLSLRKLRNYFGNLNSCCKNITMRRSSKARHPWATAEK